MFEAAAKALSQMFSPPFRRVLLKSIGLALVMIVLIGIGLNRLFAWMATSGAAWAEAGDRRAHAMWHILAWMLSIAATLGIITGAVFLMPAVTAFVGSFFVDEIADEVERTHYPADAAGTGAAVRRARCSKASRPRCSPSWSISARCRSCCSQASASSSCFSPPPICSAGNISCWRRCAFARPHEARALRRADARQRVRRRPADRDLRLDPDPQSRDAAVRAWR